MKCSEFLWNLCKKGIEHPEIPPEQRQGEVMLTIPQGEGITSDTTGEKMSPHDWAPVYGRNEKALWTAARADDRAAFDAIVLEQLGADDAYDAEKEAAQEEAAGEAEAEQAGEGA